MMSRNKIRQQSNDTMSQKKNAPTLVHSTFMTQGLIWAIFGRQSAYCQEIINAYSIFYIFSNT